MINLSGYFCVVCRTILTEQKKNHSIRVFSQSKIIMKIIGMILKTLVLCDMKFCQKIVFAVYMYGMLYLVFFHAHNKEMLT